MLQPETERWEEPDWVDSLILDDDSPKHRYWQRRLLFWFRLNMGIRGDIAFRTSYIMLFS